LIIKNRQDPISSTWSFSPKGALLTAANSALRILGHLRIRRGDPDANSPLEEARALGGPAPELQRIGTLAAICAEAAWLEGDRAGLIREVLPAYEMVLHRRDPRMKGDLAAWLWRVGGLEQLPTDIPEPYALEISRDWRGAAPAAQKLRRQMRARGVRRVPRGSRTSTRCNPHGLTRRETEILALLSDGLRNAVIARRLFVSTKTVDHHVSAILTKLGVLSRAEAVAMARNARDKGA
jgi:DNA-binding CsgD family transcriptional regulator